MFLSTSMTMRNVLLNLEASKFLALTTIHTYVYIYIYTHTKRVHVHGLASRLIFPLSAQFGPSGGATRA